MEKYIYETDIFNIGDVTEKEITMEPGISYTIFNCGVEFNEAYDKSCFKEKDFLANTEEILRMFALNYGPGKYRIQEINEKSCKIIRDNTYVSKVIESIGGDAVLQFVETEAVSLYYSKLNIDDSLKTELARSLESIVGHSDHTCHKMRVIEASTGKDDNDIEVGIFIGFVDINDKRLVTSAFRINKKDFPSITSYTLLSAQNSVLLPVINIQSKENDRSTYTTKMLLNMIRLNVLDDGENVYVIAIYSFDNEIAYSSFMDSEQKWVSSPYDIWKFDNINVMDEGGRFNKMKVSCELVRDTSYPLGFGSSGINNHTILSFVSHALESILSVNFKLDHALMSNADRGFNYLIVPYAATEILFHIDDAKVEMLSPSKFIVSTEIYGILTSPATLTIGFRDPDAGESIMKIPDNIPGTAIYNKGNTLKFDIDDQSSMTITDCGKYTEEYPDTRCLCWNFSDVFFAKDEDIEKLEEAIRKEYHDDEKTSV